MNDIKLNTLIEWTAEDRAKGVFPVPNGSNVTVWFSDGSVERDDLTEDWCSWGEYNTHVTAYLVHSVPQEPMVAWGIIGGDADGQVETEKYYIEEIAARYGGRVVKLVEEME